MSFIKNARFLDPREIFKYSHAELCCLPLEPKEYRSYILLKQLMFRVFVKIHKLSDVFVALVQGLENETSMGGLHTGILFTIESLTIITTAVATDA